MSLLTKRSQPNNEELLQQRFIARILQEEGQNISKAQVDIMSSSGFTNQDWFSKRSFDVNNNVLRYEHLKKHRFVDMSSRKTRNGRITKKSYPVHNRILFGHANNIVFRLSVEYTRRMKEMLALDYQIQL